MASHHEIRRRSSAADPIVESCPLARTTTFASPDRPSKALPLATAADGTNINHNHDVTTTTRDGLKPGRRSGSHSDARAMPLPPRPADPVAAPSSSSSSSSGARRRHSGSASRIPNRLSLTLPIAPPTSDPSRPVPCASGSASASTSAASSVPPTPLDSSAASPPSNVNDFIIAIAAKERKVMELREDLVREETELALLKKQFSATDVLLKRGAVEQLELSGSRTAASAAAEPDARMPRRSVDVDGRVQMAPTADQSIPTHSRRRVMRGGHTRTLSLLAPAKSKLEFSVLDEQTAGDDARFSPATDARLSQASHPALPKRASWQPRSQHNSPVVPQIVEDFKIGLRAFVEDIRQITIGDEPINGQSPQRSSQAGHFRGWSLSQSVHTDPGRSRSVQQQQQQQQQQRASAVASETPPQTAPPTPLSKRKDATVEKPKPAKSKHFSWTPLGFDSMDDTDWANWESPVPAKSTRWSGSTVNSGVMDDVQCIPEKTKEPVASAPINNKLTAETPILYPTKLEELLPNMVNRLSPSNIKRTASNLLDEWEKSLMAPSQAGVANKENAAA
ncbi:hypothetical protein E4U41_000300 [Claviceps citrina]|nr:hypothetical protein E4U41_000300 [Claviceps citrina]